MHVSNGFNREPVEFDVEAYKTEIRRLVDEGFYTSEKFDPAKLPLRAGHVSFTQLAIGNYITRGLFMDLDRNYPEHAIYTLKDDHMLYTGKFKVLEEGDWYMSLGRLFVECGDVTEYEFARKYLGGWQHWQRVQRQSKIAPLVKQWREELEIRTQSIGMRSIMERVGEGHYNASKYLSDKGWNPDRGRPSKEEKEARIKKEIMLVDELADDAARIGLVPPTIN